MGMAFRLVFKAKMPEWNRSLYRGGIVANAEIGRLPPPAGRQADVRAMSIRQQGAVVTGIPPEEKEQRRHSGGAIGSVPVVFTPHCGASRIVTQNVPLTFVDLDVLK